VFLFLSAGEELTIYPALYFYWLNSIIFTLYLYIKR